MNYETGKESLLRKICQSAFQNDDGGERIWNSSKMNQALAQKVKDGTSNRNGILRYPSNESLDTESRLELLLQQRLYFVIIQ